MTRPRLAAAAVWTLVFLVAARLAIAAWSPPWTNRLELGEAAAYLRKARSEDVQLVVFGSSRMMAAMLPSEWKAGAGAENVLSLTLNEGLLFDAYHLLREAGGLPAATTRVLVEVPYWNFNRNRVHPVHKYRMEPPEHLRQLGTLGDRLALDEPGDRLRLVAEYLWPLYLRKPLYAWIESVSSWGPDPKVRRYRPNRRSAHWGRPPRENPVFAPERIAHDHFHAAALSGFARRNLARLLDRLEAAEVEVVLVQLPVRAHYWKAVETEPGAPELIAEVDALLADRIGDGVSLVVCRLPSDCDLTERAFTDYGHMKRRGALIYTRWLHEQVTNPTAFGS